mgnify:CR=1 FL=1
MCTAQPLLVADLVRLPPCCMISMDLLDPSLLCTASDEEEEDMVDAGIPAKLPSHILSRRERRRKNEDEEGEDDEWVNEQAEHVQPTYDESDDLPASRQPKRRREVVERGDGSNQTVEGKGGPVLGLKKAPAVSGDRALTSMVTLLFVRSLVSSCMQRVRTLSS